MTIERRKHKRFSATAFLKMPVRLTPLAPYFGREVKGELIDLSAGGMALLISDIIPQGTALKITLLFPDHSKIDSIVDVRRVVPHGKKFLIGIEFLDLPGAMEQKIEKMSSDYIDCEGRIQKAEKDVCHTDCAFFSMCTKKQKCDPVFNPDTALEISFSELEKSSQRTSPPTPFR